MAKLRVPLEAGPTAVLVFLVDHGQARMDTIVHEVTAGWDTPWGSVADALSLLQRIGWAGHGLDGWVATFAGRRAVERARTTQAGGAL